MKKRIMSMILALVMLLSLASMLAYGAAAVGTTGLTLALGSARGLAGETVSLDLTLSATSLPATHDHLRCWQIAFSGAALDGANEICYSATGSEYYNMDYINASENSLSVTADAGLNTGTAAQITSSGGVKLGSVCFVIPSTAEPGDVITVTVSGIEAFCFEDDAFNLYDEAQAVTVVSGTIEVMEDIPVAGLTVSLGTAYAVAGGTAAIEVFLSAQSLPYTHEMLRDWQFRFSGANVHARAQGESKPYTVLCYPEGSDYGFVNNEKNQVGNTCDHNAYCASAWQVTARGGIWLGTILFDVPAGATGEITVSISNVDVMHFQDRNLIKYDVKNQLTLVSGKIIVVDGVDGVFGGNSDEIPNGVYQIPEFEGNIRINSLPKNSVEGNYDTLIVPASVTSIANKALRYSDFRNLVIKGTDMDSLIEISRALDQQEDGVTLYYHKRPNGLDTLADGLMAEDYDTDVVFKNLLACHDSLIVDDSDVYVIGGIAAMDLNYADISIVAKFTYVDAGTGKMVVRKFEATTDSVYTTLMASKTGVAPYGIASTNETTATAQGSEYTEGLQYITGMVIRDVPQGSYTVDVTVYGRTHDAIGSLITVCSETVEVTVTVP